jgi:hypothetical protein
MNEIEDEIILPTGKIINDFLKLIKRNKNVKLLKQKEVLQWLFDDKSFLPEGNNKSIYEDEWGKRMLKIKRPDLNPDCQWTTKFGEHIVEELYEILDKNPIHPKKIKNFIPEIEIDYNRSKKSNSLYRRNSWRKDTWRSF